LWGFDIRKKRDVDGREIEPEMGMIRGFLSVPKPFECEVTPRSAQHVRVIRESFREAEKNGIDF